MKKNAGRKLTLNKESLRNLTAVDARLGGAAIGGTTQSIKVGCTTENTWYCPTASACTNCPICNA
jgi:hypothetical protein